MRLFRSSSFIRVGENLDREFGTNHFPRPPISRLALLPNPFLASSPAPPSAPPFLSPAASLLLPWLEATVLVPQHVNPIQAAGTQTRNAAAMRKLPATRRKTLCDITNLRRPLVAEEGQQEGQGEAAARGRGSSRERWPDASEEGAWQDEWPAASRTSWDAPRFSFCLFTKRLPGGDGRQGPHGMLLDLASAYLPRRPFTLVLLRLGSSISGEGLNPIMCKKILQGLLFLLMAIIVNAT